MPSSPISLLPAAEEKSPKLLTPEPADASPKRLPSGSRSRKQGGTQPNSVSKISVISPGDLWHCHRLFLEQHCSRAAHAAAVGTKPPWAHTFGSTALGEETRTSRVVAGQRLFSSQC